MKRERERIEERKQTEFDKQINIKKKKKRVEGDEKSGRERKKRERKNKYL